MADCYCVYAHIFPNGKAYIGITNDTKKRWRNGSGYSHQTKMARAIEKYGWGNVRHAVLRDRLTQEEAKQEEKRLIQEFDSIRNGYNVSIGGGSVSGGYVCPYVSEMILAAKRFWPEMRTLATLADSDRKDKKAAEFWNEASRAVTLKHGEYSATDECEVAQFWYYMGQYTELAGMIARGEDVTNWEEKPCEQAVCERYGLAGAAI